MTAAPTIEPRTLAPWWSAEKCRSHQPYPTLRAAEKAADLHPIFSTKCPKCDEGMKVQPFKCHSEPRPMHWHIGHDFARPGEGTRMTLPAPGNIEALRPRRKGGRPAKLTGEQAREIAGEAGTGGLSMGRAKQLGSQYGVSFSTIYDIVMGRSYAWATADLRPAPTPKEAPKAEPKRGDDYQAMKDGHAEREWAERQRIKAEYQQREDERKAKAAKPDLSTYRNLQGDPSANSALIVDLADAAEVLLDVQAGKPLPKFVTLDTEAIRRLVELARRANGS